jgi:trimeric autotransporter adhesin
MANEFIARKGLIVLNNGAKITGSFSVSSDSIFNGPVTASSGATGSFTGSFKGDGSQLTGLVTDLRITGSTGTDTVSLLTDSLSLLGSNGVTTVVTNNTVTIGIPTGTVSASSQVDHNATTNYVANQHIDHSTVNITAGSGLSGGGDITATRTLTLDTSSAHFISGSRNVITFTDTTGASGIDFTYTAGTASAVLQNSAVTVTAGSGLSGGGSVSLGGTTTVTLDTSSAHFTGGVKSKLNTDGVFSSSIQTDVRQTTGIATIATTGSNTFTGIQTISNTTNSTNYADGALIVQGGVGIAKDVNISGSLNVTGLLTAVSMSTQYVTSSQYVVGVSRVVVNDDDNVRFAGLSVIDSGSSYGTGSLLWDSFNNRWIYQADDVAYNSAVIIAGPQNTGSLGDEVGLITGRIPVAVGDDHIDTRPAVSPLRVAGTTLHAEGNVYVTGSVTASAFSGDGSNLTGIVTNLNITGSDGGTGTVSLKTQALTVDGTNGLTATVSGQTITISGSDATTTTKGVAAFNSANFSVVGGQVTASAITFNSVPLNLGSAYSFGLANITSQGATTADQLVLNGGAVIHGVLFTSGSNADVDTGTEVVATVQTGSYDAAFFDYVVKKGSSYRAGTVMAVWEAGTSNVEFTDTSTNDLGNTTDVVFVVDILSATARLKATVASDNWIVKTAVRAL